MPIAAVFIFFMSVCVSHFSQATAIDYAAPWREITGPGVDPKCSGSCRTGQLTKTIQCPRVNGPHTGLMTLRHASQMFCPISGSSHLDSEDVKTVDRNADKIFGCLQVYHNADDYNVFIHEMLCQWKICAVHPPPNPTAKKASWIELARGKIELTFFDGRSPPLLSDTSDFALSLMARDLSLCDVTRSSQSSPPQTPVEMAKPATSLEPRSRSRKNISR